MKWNCSTLIGLEKVFIENTKRTNRSNSPDISPQLIVILFNSSKFHLIWFHMINLHALICLKQHTNLHCLSSACYAATSPLVCVNLLQLICHLMSFPINSKTLKLVRRVHIIWCLRSDSSVGERVQHAGMQHPEMSVCIQLNTHKHPKTDDQTQLKSLQAEQREKIQYMLFQQARDESQKHVQYKSHALPELSMLMKLWLMHYGLWVTSSSKALTVKVNQASGLARHSLHKQTWENSKLVGLNENANSFFATWFHFWSGKSSQARL